MRRWSELPCLSLLALSVVSVPLGTEAATRDEPVSRPTFAAEAELVFVDVVALDEHGRPVTGLTQADFTLREDGRPQELTRFEALELRAAPGTTQPAVAVTARVSSNTRAAAAGRSFVVVFDDVHVSSLTLERAREALASFVRDTLRDGDRVTLVPSSGAAWWSARLPEGRASLLRYLTHLRALRPHDASPAHISDYEALRIAHGDQGELARVFSRYGATSRLPAISPAGELDVTPGLDRVRNLARTRYQEVGRRLQATLASLARVVAALEREPGRKTVVLVSEGFVLDHTRPDLRELLRAARAARVVLYFVDVRGPAGSGAANAVLGAADLNRSVALERPFEAAQDVLGALSSAADTGGFSVSGTHALGAGLRRIADEAGASYVLGYVPTRARRAGKFRRLEVRVGRPGVHVRARPGYHEPGGKRARHERPEGPSSLLDAPADDDGLALRLTSFVLTPLLDGTRRVLLVAEADPRGLALRPAADGLLTGRLATTLSVAALETGRVFIGDEALAVRVHAGQDVPMRRALALSPGTYQARLLVRDEAGRHGTVRHDFVVEAPLALQASTPLLSDTLDEGQRPLPLARRTFAAGSRLFALFEIYGAARADRAARVEADYEVLGPDGAVFTRAAPHLVTPSAQGGLSRLVALSLSGAAAGPYELRLRVADHVAQRAFELREPFEVQAPAAAP